MGSLPNLSPKASAGGTFTRYWWLILRSVPEHFLASANRVRVIVGVIILLAFATNRDWGKKITSKWEGVPGRYVWIVIGLILLYRLMRTIYQQDADLVKRLAAAELTPSDDAEREQFVRAKLDTLDKWEKALLKELLVEGSMTDAHALGFLNRIGGTDVKSYLSTIDFKTNFLTKNFVGRFEIKPEFKSLLAKLLA